MPWYQGCYGGESCHPPRDGTALSRHFPGTVHTLLDEADEARLEADIEEQTALELRARGDGRAREMMRGAK